MWLDIALGIVVARLVIWVLMAIGYIVLLISDAYLDRQLRDR